MRRSEDFTEMAQLAIEQGVPGEAQSVLEKAFAAKTFTEARDIERNTRLLNSAKQQATADRASLAKDDKAAAALKTGEADVRIGLAYLSYGQVPQALAAIQRGIGKGGLKSPAEAQLLLGITQYRAGNKADAVKAFKSVDGDATLARLGKLWALRAQ
jgi:tetratricopeptide (TPR) repeat protein